jgi:hypothetical protein
MNKDLETQVLEYEERTFAFNENAGLLEQQIADRMTSPVQIMRSIIRLVSGKSFMDVPLVGSLPAETFAIIQPRASIAAGGTMRLKGMFAHRATGFYAWNYDATNGLRLDVNSAEGGFQNLYYSPNYAWGDNLSMSPDTELVFTNNSAGPIFAQLYLKGW